jgi:hypothetical protein
LTIKMEISNEQNGQRTNRARSKTHMTSFIDKKRALLRDLYALPGDEILDRILNLERPRELIQKLPPEDFFWLVKKIGDDDCLPVIGLASVDQWQYILDLEIWDRDRLDLSQIFHWINLLQKADSRRLARWLLSEGRSFAYHYFLRTVRVKELENNDGVYDLPKGYLSLGGDLHIKVMDQKHRETVENMISAMAAEDFGKFQDLFLELGGAFPSVLEEELYRLRNIRLAEHGFLPFEEAVTVYSPLGLNVLKSEKDKTYIDMQRDEEIRDTVPLLPLAQTGVKNLFVDEASKVEDPILLDRLRLEFAGLVNQIIAADRLIVHDTEVLIHASKKAARFINLAIEETCSSNQSLAQDILRHYPLITLFRVGFGMLLNLKREAERWLKMSWFHRQGLNIDFWGEQWGGILTGLLGKKPRLYVGPEENTGYRDFGCVSELNESRNILYGLMELDRLFERLEERYPMDERMLRTTGMTFHPMLFNIWARFILKLEPCYEGISVRRAKHLFRLLRGGSEAPPFQMTGFKKTFIQVFMPPESGSDPEAASILKDTLSVIWQEFSEEYEWVSVDDLDGKFSRFITIENNTVSTAQ